MSVGLGQIFMHIAVRMSTFDYLMGLKPYSVSYNSICGATAGLCATLITYPSDLLRKLMHLNGSSPDHQYANLFDLLKQVYNK